MNNKMLVAVLVGGKTEDRQKDRCSACSLKAKCSGGGILDTI